MHISEIKERGYKLDVTWLKDDSLEDADEAIAELEAVVDDLREIVALVEKEEGVEKCTLRLTIPPLSGRFPA